MRLLECEGCGEQFGNHSPNGVSCPGCGCKRVLEVMDL